VSKKNAVEVRERLVALAPKRLIVSGTAGDLVVGESVVSPSDTRRARQRPATSTTSANGR